MSHLKWDLDISKISAEFGDLKKKVESDLMIAASALAASTHAKVTELAQKNLHSSRKQYTDALSFQEVSKGVWVVGLDRSAMWIEDGRKQGFMEELLNGKSAKTTKDGKKYAVIPFKHDKNPSEQTVSAQNFTQQIRKELKQRSIPYKKLEYKDGSPRIGLIHKFDVTSARPSTKAKNDALKGISIYQSMGADGKVRRDILTFRVITEDHRAEGLWVHPGIKARNFFDQAFEWCVSEWENKILPDILADYTAFKNK
jgi:hypothetical protein